MHPGLVGQLVEHQQRGARRPRHIAYVKARRSAELWYSTKLVALVRKMRRAVEPGLIKAIAKLPQIGDGMARDEQFDIERFLSMIAKFQAPAMALAKVAAMKGNSDANVFLTQAAKAVGLKMDGILNQIPNTSLDKRIADNVALIKSIPTQYHDKVRQAIEEGQREGMRHEQLISRIKELGDITERRAQVIARDQTSKFMSEVNRDKQQKLGLVSYRWQTSGDERVRDTHADNDGKVFRWDEPPSETGHPGDDIQCRCNAIPIFDWGDDSQPDGA